jgi:hypothetical protein
MGEVGLDHGMNKQHLQRIRDLEKENQQLKVDIPDHADPLKLEA